MSEIASGTNLKRGLSYSALSFVSTVVLGLVSALVTSRLYGVEVVGEFAIVSTPWLIAARVSTLDEQIALARRLAVLTPGSNEVGGLFLAVLSFSAVFTTVVAALVFLTAAVVLSGPVAAPELLLPAAIVLAGYVLVHNTSWNIDTVLASFGAGRAIFITNAVQLVSLIVGVVALSFVTETVWGIVIATVASFACGLAARIWAVRPFTPLVPGRVALRDGWQELGGIVRYGAVLFPGSLSSGLADQSAYWILGATQSVSVVGAFARAHGLARRMEEAPWRVGEILFPELVRRRQGGDEAGFAHAFATAARYAGFALLLLAAAGGGVTGPILRVFGTGFDAAADALAILLIAYGVGAVATIQSYAVLAALRPRVLTALQVSRSVLIVAVALPGALLAGATGVATAILAGNVASAVATTWILRRRVVRPGDPCVGWPLAVRATVSLAAGLMVSRLIGHSLPDLLALPLGMAIGGAVYLVVAVLVGFVGRQDLDELLGQVRPSARLRFWHGKTASDVDDGAPSTEIHLARAATRTDLLAGVGGFERLVSPVAVLDHRGVIIQVNESWKRAVEAGDPLLFDAGLGSRLVSFWMRSAPGDDHGAVRAAGALKSVLERSVADVELEVRDRATGSERWFLAQVASIDGGGAVLQLIDISLRKQLELRLARLAGLDPLTGMLNRLGLEEYLRAELSGRGRTSILVLRLDLDSLEPLDGTSGSLAADAVTTEVADRLRDVVRSTDVLARVESGAFVIVAGGADPDGQFAHGVLEQVRSVTDLPLCVEGQVIELGASVAVVVMQAGDDVRTVLSRANGDPERSPPT